MEISLLKQETLLQLRKDFGTLWDEVENEPLNFDYLYTKTFSILKKIQHTQAFMSMLYKIDIPEADYKASMQAINSLEVLSELIIKREFLKVLFRKNYQIDNKEELFKRLKS